jgi:hypothetical protein
MGISILEPVLGIEDEDLTGWLLRLTACSGITKDSPAERCARCAERLLDLMLEQRQRVVDGIRDRLISHGFDAEDTYRDWIMALQQIIKLSEATDGDCSWSAPALPDDENPIGNLKRFMKVLGMEE